jgi:hypothetical protein
LLKQLCAEAALVLVGLYFYKLSFTQPPPPGNAAAAVVAVQCMALALGPIPASFFWPVSGWVLPSLAAVTIVLMTIAGLRQREERGRTAGLLLFLVSIAALCAAVGFGRSSCGGAGFPARYIVFGLPTLWCVYLAWILYVPAKATHTAQMALFTLVCATFLMNVETGIYIAKGTRQVNEAFKKDLRAGMAPLPLAERYAPHYFPPNARFLAESFCMLHRHQFGIFRYLNDPTDSHAAQGR